MTDKSTAVTDRSSTCDCTATDHMTCTIRHARQCDGHCKDIWAVQCRAARRQVQRRAPAGQCSARQHVDRCKDVHRPGSAVPWQHVDRCKDVHRPGSAVPGSTQLFHVEITVRCAMYMLHPPSNHMTPFHCRHQQLLIFPRTTDGIGLSINDMDISQRWWL